MENEKFFEFMTKMYSEMKEGFNKLDKRLEKVEGEVKKTNTAIEHDIKPKIQAML